jgi:hypothetical protein
MMDALIGLRFQVDHAYVVASFEKVSHDLTTNESGSTGNKDSHGEPP